MNNCQGKKNKAPRKPFSRISRLLKWLFRPPRNILSFIWKLILSLFGRKTSIYTALGAHFISGYPGSGKTLLCNQLIQSIDKDKYFCLSNIKEFANVGSFNLSDIFNGGKQVKKFPIKDDKDRQLYAVIFDEINLDFNRRMNRTREYNELFIGLIEFLVAHRHQGVPRVYFIGQKLDLQDTQLQSLFKFQHEIIDTKRRYRYWYYHLFSFLKIPVKIGVVNRVKNLEDEFIEINFDKIKINRSSLLSYNTKALAEIYEALPEVKINK